MSMKETLDKASTVKPIANRNGSKIVSYEDATVLVQAQMMEEQYGATVDLGDREINPDGTVGRSRSNILAINEDRRLANLYRVAGKQGGGKKLQVVIDYRAVTEHDTGQVYIARIPVYEFERVDKELKMVGMTTVSDEDFISKFTARLSNKAMYEVLAAINENTEEVGVDEMPI